MHNLILMRLHKHFFARLWWPAVVVLFLMAGLIGHDPWKQDETYSFGIIYHFYTTDTWLIPVNAGLPFMEKPPLYYWSAVVFCHLFDWLLPMHDAARLTNLFYMLITIYGIHATARTLYHDSPYAHRLGTIAVVLCLGSLTIVRHAHDMFTDVAQLSGMSLALYGMALMLTDARPLRAGLWLGLGTGVAFLSKGLFVPALLGGTFILLYGTMPIVRRMDTVKTLLIAALTAAPFFILWPLALYRAEPALFHEWFWENNLGRFLGYSVPRLGADNPHHLIPTALLMFAFPVFPLAILGMATSRRNWRSFDPLDLPLISFLVGAALLLVSATGRALYIMPLMPPLAILAAPALYAVPEAFLYYWNRGVILLFTILTAVIWLLWIALSLHVTNAFTRFFGLWLPLDFTPAHSETYNCIFAFAVAALWGIYIMCHPHNHAQERSAYLWLAGVTLAWGTAYSLLLPWIDDTKSYRPLLEEAIALAHSHDPHGCITPFHLGESIAPMVEYIQGYDENPAGFGDARCPFLLIATKRSEARDVQPAWKLLWYKSRPLDAKDEELRLYQRQH